VDQAEQEAKRLTGRWRKRVHQFLTQQQQHRERGTELNVPVWVTVGGKLQERSMATHWATALWGDDLVLKVQEMATQHFVTGSDDQWREYLLHVEPI
jgi:hypothetical protein